MEISLDSAMAALRKVMDPELHRDLVSLGMIKDLRVDGGAASLEVELTTPACPLKDTIARDVETALRGAGATRVDLRFGARVRSAPGVAQSSMTPGVKNIVLVGAGKGGVGKSTVTINLALSLARTGAKVGVLDADIYGPSLPLLTGVTERPATVGGNRLDPIEAHGLKLMSIGFLVDPDQAMIWRGPMVTGALLQLMRDVNWGELDYLLLDLPPGTGDVPLTLAQNVKAAGVVLVSTPQDMALADVIRAKLMFDKVGIPVLGIVENMSTFICPSCGHETHVFRRGGGERTARELDTPFLGSVPLDAAIAEGGDAGIPIVIAEPKGPHAAAFAKIAAAVAAALGT
jgi:ATP-binding protein involved in chromosome partitioning